MSLQGAECPSAGGDFQQAESSPCEAQRAGIAISVEHKQQALPFLLTHRVLRILLKGNCKRVCRVYFTPMDSP